MFFPFPMRFGVTLIILSSLIVSSNAANENVEKVFRIGDSVTFQCQRHIRVDDEDFLMKWTMGTKTIFENNNIVAGVPNAARYSVNFTATDFDLTISSLTEADVGKKIICRLDDGDTTMSLKTYKLKLQQQPMPKLSSDYYQAARLLAQLLARAQATQATAKATTAAPTVKPDDDTVDANDDTGSAYADITTFVDKSDNSKETKLIDENDLNDNPDAGGGASSLAFSSLLAAILATLHALTLLVPSNVE